MDATADDWMFDGYDGEEEGSDYSEPQDDDSKWGNSLQEKVKQKRAENAKNLGKFAENGAANISLPLDEIASHIINKLNVT